MYFPWGGFPPDPCPQVSFIIPFPGVYQGWRPKNPTAATVGVPRPGQVPTAAAGLAEPLDRFPKCNEWWLESQLLLRGWRTLHQLSDEVQSVMAGMRAAAAWGVDPFERIINCCCRAGGEVTPSTTARVHGNILVKTWFV